MLNGDLLDSSPSISKVRRLGQRSLLKQMQALTRETQQVEGTKADRQVEGEEVEIELPPLDDNSNFDMEGDKNPKCPFDQGLDSDLDLTGWMTEEQI
ncbi:hypothetical protein DXG01_008593 [Tephrocybe rancida]|nr:hypothetical protein DXG01_008593 [Tephrocybe rancida]